MTFLNVIFEKNKALANLGSLFLLMSLGLLAYLPFNQVEVLGINSLIKPLKFSLSIWIFCWTMAYLLHFVQDQKLVWRLTLLIIITMLYEQAVITIQAFRGTLSHFNNETPFEAALFALMGVMITVMTLYILYTGFRFMKQEDKLPKALKYSIFWGIWIFSLAGLMGGVMGGLESHSIGGEMGGEGLAFVNWSTKHGDLRIGHFVGLHAIQVLPFVGIRLSKATMSSRGALFWVHGFSLAYAGLVTWAFARAFMGLSGLI